MRKQGGKTGGLINKKALKLNEIMRKKIGYLYFVQYFVQCFVRVKNPQNLAKKMEKKNKRIYG